MRVLVTGGNGFIGKHVVDELLSRGIEVISVDIAPSSEKKKGVTYVTGTVIDEFLLGPHLKKCDAVLHLAAILGVKRADKQLLRCLTINIQGTVKMLEACVMNNVKHILVVSSSEIFGDVHKGKINEVSPLNPKSGYAISKLAAEKYTEAFSAEYGLKYNIVRFFNIYGPGQVAEFVVPRFIKMAGNGIRPVIYGDGKQIRSFCYITDASRALVDIFLNKDTVNQTFNIGNDDEPVSVLDLAKTVIKIAGADMEPEFVEFKGSDRDSSREIYFRVPDITKIKKVIGFKPKVTLKEGIKKVMDSGDIPDSWVEPLVSKG